MKFGLLLKLFLIVSLLTFLSCQKERFTSDPNDKLEFSTDTIMFDTVFTAVGSATRTLKVRNPHNKSIKISRIYLQQEAGAHYRFNVDGYVGLEAQDITIAPHDSLYVFAQVTVDPNQPVAISPFVINDLLTFECNGNTQSVVLEAWGQNANYIPSNTAKGKVALLTCNLGEETWNDPKPYVIYGALLIDSCTLVIPEGTRIYVHGGYAKSDIGYYNDGQIHFLQHGKLNIVGSKEKPVTIQGDRLEQSYQDIPGQWGFIRLNPGSSASVSYAHILNATIGIYVDSASSLTLKNSIIGNSSVSNLYAIHSTINAENSLIHTSGSNSVYLAYGGDYTFTYCTISNYTSQKESVLASTYICRDEDCLVKSENPLNLYLSNTILYGSYKDALGFLKSQTEPLVYKLDHCITQAVDIYKTNPDFNNYCESTIFSKFGDKLFKRPSDWDFHLDTLSIAEQKALPVPGILKDLEDNLRDLQKPDIGCYEYQY